MRRVIAVAGCVLVLAACGSSASASIPPPERLETVWSDGYNDVVAFCDNGNRVYIYTAKPGGGIAVAAGSCAR